MKIIAKLRKKLADFLKSADKKVLIIVAILFCLFSFFRFYALETKNVFGPDQVDNAWAAKEIIDDKKFPLAGMEARGSSGFFIGPLYYYYITPFYLLTDLDPVASGIIAGVSAIITFVVFALIVSKIFSLNVALIGLFFLTFSFHIINFDRLQGPVSLIPLFSLIIYYSLYKILTGYPKYIFLLAVALGSMFNLHFTAFLFLPIVALSVFFFPRKKDTLLYLTFSIPIFLLFVAPIFIHSYISSGIPRQNFTNFLNDSVHGLSTQGFLQLKHEIFMEFESLLFFPVLEFAAPLIFILFLLLMLYKTNRKKLVIFFLSVVWILSPWMVFSSYTNPIIDYYLRMTMPVIIISISFVLYRLIKLKNPFIILLIGLVALYYAFFNVKQFFEQEYEGGLKVFRERTMEKISNGENIRYRRGLPDSYLYYINVERKK